ncbi:MAG: dienelactone hydrolase family protein [Acidobacteria bacterium]|nr:dienelactone hydrolase family protein [Acidobacteriota bacterium]
MNTAPRMSVGLAVALVAALHAGSAQAAVKTQYVEYMHGTTPLKGYLAYDDAVSGRRPAVLLVHYRGGLQGSTLEDAQMIARLGYVVFAADIFGRDIVPKTVPEMTKLTDVYNGDRQLMRTRAQAGFDALVRNPMVDASKVAIIGYCFGGTVAVELAETGVPVVGTVAVHGSFRNFTPAAARNIKGPVLILHGAEDEVAPLEEVNKLIADLRAAKVPWEMQLYSGSSHGFTAPSNPQEQRADQEYKRSIRRFFTEVFGR